MFTSTLFLLLFIATSQRILPTCNEKLEYENTLDSICANISSSKRDIFNNSRASPHNLNKSLYTVVLLLAGDIHLNPGPRNASVYPCGLCDCAVTWQCRGVACDGCSVWYHGSCIELCTNDFALLERSSVQWLCHKCDSINCDSFTFRSFSLNCSNFYSPLTDSNLTLDSMNSTFSPLKTSSPRTRNNETRDSSKYTKSKNDGTEKCSEVGLGLVVRIPALWGFCTLTASVCGFE